MKLKHHAAPACREGAMKDTAGTHGVGRRLEDDAALSVFVISDNQVPLEEKHFFLMIVNEWLRRV
jgi:hypothetical protein